MKKLFNSPVEPLISEPVVVEPTATLSKVIGALRESGAYEAFLQVGDRIGMVTTRDLLRATSTTSTKVKTVTIYVPALGRDGTVGEAARLMHEYRIRTVPVMERGELIGAVTALALIRWMRPLLGGVRAQDVMTPKPVTVARGDTIAKARSLMVRRRFDHLPVVDGQELVGIVTSTHVLYALFPPLSMSVGDVVGDMIRRLEPPVERIMDRTVNICLVSDSLDKVVGEMLEVPATYAVATLFEELQGIITYRDIVQLAVERERPEIPLYLIGLPEDPLEAEATRIKFIRIITSLRRSFPDIVEARSIIKTRGQGERRRYEVDVMVKTPTQTIAHSEEGWDLPSLYDRITDRLKRLLSRRAGRRVPTRREDVEEF